jgi:hypothetical protein
MNISLRIRLQTTEEQNARLLQLQAAFAAVCNALAPVAQQNACWNRVALHHLVYRAMRQQYPQIGSQMICNAIYSVSRACRLVYQHPQSPFNLQRTAGKPLPLLRFQPQSPVYFDRHTLSLKDGQVSLYTLDGRMRFNLPLSAEDETRFREAKLREIVLVTHDAGFWLNFTFAEAGETAEDDSLTDRQASADLPEYLLVIEDASPTPALNWPAPRAYGAHDDATSAASPAALPQSGP